jgi:hypothetical protein
MKTHYILCAAILFPQLALAITSSNPPPGNVQASSYGTVQATLDYCARIDPASATRYQDEARLIVGAQFKTTNEYKDGYSRAQDALGKVSAHDGKAACADFLEPVKVGEASHAPDDTPANKDRDHDGQKH